MKIDSKYLEIDIDPEFASQQGKILGRARGFEKEFEFWDDGDIMLSQDAWSDSITFNYRELDEIVRVYKLFKTQRDFYLVQKEE